MSKPMLYKSQKKKKEKKNKEKTINKLIILIIHNRKFCKS